MGYGPLAPEATEIRDATLSSIDAYHPAMLGANAPGPDNPFVTQDDLGTMVDTGSFAFAKGAASHSVVTIQFKDRRGANLAFPVLGWVWVSDDPNGLGLSATKPTSVSVTTGASLIDLAQVPEATMIQSDATGKMVIDVGSNTKALYYIAAHLSGGDAAYVSRQMVTGDYG